MPAPMVIPIVLFGAAALGVAAMDGGKKRKVVGRRYTLDAELPAPLRDQVLAALASEKSPDKLEAFASAIAPSYPLTASALRTKASVLRYANPASVVPNTDDPLAAIPEPAHSQIADQLARQTDPSALETYATQLAPIYPAAATLLRVRAMQVRALTASAAAAATTSPALPAPPPIVAPPTAPTPPPTPAAPLPTPPPIAAPIPIATAPTTTTAPLPTPPPIAPTPSAPAPSATTSPGLPTTPTPPIAPTTILDGLDPGMPIEVRKAVLGAITAETDPSKLEGFASAIQAQYPIAAGLLIGKAQTLRGASASASASPTPTAAPPPTPPTPAPASTALTRSPYKMGDDLTRVGRNGGRPSGFPFIVLRPTDATYPAKIAKEATGFEGNYGEMTSLNPHLAPDGKWMNLVAGDALNIPWEWAPKLTGRYDVRTDPGVTPATSPVGNAAPLIRSSTLAPTPSATPTPTLPAAPASTTASTTASTPSSSSSATPTYTPVSTIAPSSSSSVAALPPTPPQVPDPMLTYVVQPGDSPMRIAGNIVHDQSRWHELVAANPKKRTAADGSFASLMAGERLTLPDSWVSTSLAARSSAPAGGSHAAFA